MQPDALVHTSAATTPPWFLQAPLPKGKLRPGELPGGQFSLRPQLVLAFFGLYCPSYIPPTLSCHLTLPGGLFGDVNPTSLPRRTYSWQSSLLCLGFLHSLFIFPKARQITETPGWITQVPHVFLPAPLVPPSDQVIPLAANLFWGTKAQRVNETPACLCDKSNNTHCSQGCNFEHKRESQPNTCRVIPFSHEV